MRGGHRILPRYSAAVLWPRSTISILIMKRMLSKMDRSPTLEDRNSNVRFGSKADICSATRHVRFTPNSDIDCVSRHVRFGSKVDIRFVIQSLDRREREQDGSRSARKSYAIL